MIPRVSTIGDWPSKVVAAEVRAAKGGLDLDLVVVGIGADLEPARSAAIEAAEADLGEVGQEDVGEVDHQSPALGVDAQRSAMP